MESRGHRFAFIVAVVVRAQFFSSRGLNNLAKLLVHKSNFILIKAGRGGRLSSEQVIPLHTG